MTRTRRTFLVLMHVSGPVVSQPGHPTVESLLSHVSGHCLLTWRCSRDSLAAKARYLVRMLIYHPVLLRRGRCLSFAGMGVSLDPTDQRTESICRHIKLRWLSCCGHNNNICHLSRQFTNGLLLRHATTTRRTTTGELKLQRDACVDVRGESWKAARAPAAGQFSLYQRCNSHTIQGCASASKPLNPTELTQRVCK